MTSGRPWLTRNILGVLEIHLQLVWVALSSWTDRPQGFFSSWSLPPKEKFELQVTLAVSQSIVLNSAAHAGWSGTLHST